jgi:molybdopterin-guanine dinucleotide biosynthesis protein A
MIPSATTGIVLAGGRSSRFGSDKLAAQLDGEPLLWRPIRALAAAGCVSIVVVLTPDLDEPTLPSDLGLDLRLVRDPESFGGPLIGLRTGLAAVASGSVAIVVAGDQPGLGPALLRMLVDARVSPTDAGLPGGRSPAAVVLVDPGGVARPLPCVIDRERASATADRLLAGGERRLRALIAALDAREVPEVVWRSVDPGASWTVDVDRPEDLERLH